MKVRIGIDVGGTFTDAVLITNDTYELIGQCKVPTTHDAAEGVAKGIVAVLHEIMRQHAIKPQDVTFIAHGTTQATNALLEGDVVKVGVVGWGTGMEGRKARTDTQIGRIELAPDRFLETSHQFIESADTLDEAIQTVASDGAKVVVGATPFSVDDPENEKTIMERAVATGLPAVGSHEISKLYGLKTRTRTAVINASILPKMVEAAAMTDESVKGSGIEAPLMIMRCDGGVMGVAEVMQRPILTMLSGPAAGVAGALMYERISHGLFLEVGGTSTDISAIVNGRVMVDYAEVGGHKTYVHSLDVRTVGIAGGSLVRLQRDRLIEAGPRSAHIAGLPYVVFTDPEELAGLKLITIQPRPNDSHDYVAVENENGARFGITVACAANLLGLVPEDDYARGNIEAARIGLTPLAERLGCSIEEAAEQIMQLATTKNIGTIKGLLTDYEMDAAHTVLVGGGGGAATIVPHLAKTLGMEHRIAQNAQVISPIGVALALVRDVVERTVSNPTQDDIISIRQEAEQSVIRSGAEPSTVEVHVEIDAQRNILRAVATGATALRTRRRGQVLSQDELLNVAASSMGMERENVERVAGTAVLQVFAGRVEKRRLFGLMRHQTHALRVIDQEGVIRLQLSGGTVRETRIERLQSELKEWIEKASSYGDGGIEMPRPYILTGGRILDLTGLVSPEQVASLAQAELGTLSDDEDVIVVLGSRTG